MDAVARVAILFESGSNEAVHTAHYRITESFWGEGGEDALEELCEWVRDNLAAQYMAFYPPSWRYKGVSATEAIPLIPTGVIPKQFVLAGDVPGSGNSNIDIPIFMACQVKLSTGLASRSFRGRMWMPPIFRQNELEGGGEVTDFGSYAPAVVQLLTAYDTEVSLGGAVNAHQVVYSRTRRNRGLVPYYADVVARTFDTKVRVLRSRQD